MLLLDTCTLLWLAADSSQLSPGALKAIEQSQQSPAFSAISALEIAIKHRRNKITLPCPPDEWIAEIARHHQLVEITVTAAIAANAGMLPLIHSDPFDRIIVATAMLEGCLVVTPDHLIQTYPGVRTIW